MSTESQIPPERLIEAVDAIFNAYDEVGSIFFSQMPSDWMGHPDQPEALCAFTRFEIEEAERFLVRAGLLEHKHPNHFGSDHDGFRV